MRNTITSIALLILSTVSILAQEAEMRFSTEASCEKQEYCVTIEIRSTDGMPFGLGTSSFYFEYNKEALDFKSFTPRNFDNANKCVQGIFAPYAPQQYDAHHDGIINTTLTLTNIDGACPMIEDAYIPIATFCFDIEDPSKNSNLTFSRELTNFNLAEEGIEVIEFVEFKDNTELLSCHTMNAVDIRVDETTSSLAALNNPVITNANIAIDVVENSVWDFIIFDVSGRKVFQTREDLPEGDNYLKFDMSNYPKGIYVLNAISGNNSESCKIIKQ